MKVYRQIFHAFSDELPVSIEAIGAGNINDTLKVVCPENTYLLQRINHEVFKRPQDVQENYRLIYDRLAAKQVPLLLPQLLRTQTEQLYYQTSEGAAWRLLSFLKDTIAYEQPGSIEQVREAAAKIGQFVAALNTGVRLPIKETITGFHDFQARYRAFEGLLQKAESGRLLAARTAIDFIKRHASQVPNYQALNIPLRVVHNDPKIGNVLFNTAGKVVAVIDWDTVMPGYLATDLGDMIRTMAVTADENESDIAKVDLKDNYLVAALQEFLRPLRTLIKPTEIESLASGPLYIALEQALRFLSDYLVGDVYYKIQYPEHNLNRSLNQIALCQAILQREALIRDTIAKVIT